MNARARSSDRCYERARVHKQKRAFIAKSARVHKPVIARSCAFIGAFIRKLCAFIRKLCAFIRKNILMMMVVIVMTMLMMMLATIIISIINITIIVIIINILEKFL